MAHLQKLQISGFRSFGQLDDEAGKMSFIDLGNRRVWPLTLILGQNGCGKTTIIECLRYATTGDTPPGSGSGRSFVHDPKMAGEAKVKGCVKLVFQGTDGKIYHVSRIMEATQKAKSLSIKTLDGSFARKDGNGWSAIGTKCADINSLVLDYMGVSKPILNYVIFCHQEESNWPLEEGSKVKAKFDEIFNSSKYQQVLKNFKDVAKTHREKLKSEKDHIRFYQDDMRLAREKKEELEKKQMESQILEDKIQKAEEEESKINEEIKRLTELETNYSGILQAKTECETRLDERKRQIREIEEKPNRMKVHDNCTDKKLEEIKINLDKEARVKQQRLSTINDSLDEEKRKLQEANDLRAKLIGKVANHRARQTNYTNNKNELCQRAEQIGNELGWDESFIQGFEASQEDDRENLTSQMNASISKAENCLKKVTQEMDAKVEAKTNEVHDVEKDKALSEDKKRRLASDLVETKKEIAVIKKQLKDSQDAISMLDELKENQETKESELNSVKKSVNLEQLKSATSKLKQELKEYEKKEMALREEKAVIDANQKILTDISIKEEDSKGKQEQLDRLSNKFARDLETVFDSKRVPKTEALNNEFHLLSVEITNEKKKFDTEIQTKKSQIESQKSERKKLQDEINLKDKRIKAFRDNLNEVMETEDKSVEEELEEVRQELDETRLEINKKEAIKIVNQDLIEKMELRMSQGHGAACPTCDRGFKNNREGEQLKADLEDEIRNNPQRVKTIKQKLEKLQLKYDRLQKIRPDYIQMNEFREEVETRQRTVKGLDQSIKKLTQEIKSHENNLESIDEKFHLCERLREHVFTMDNLSKQVKDLNEKVEELRQSNEGLEGTRSLEEFRAEDELVCRKLTGIRKSLEMKQKQELDTERKINALEKEINSLQQERLTIEKQQQESAALDKKKSELELKVDELRVEQNEVNKALESLVLQIEEKEKERNKVAAERSSKVATEREKCDEIKSYKNELDSITKRIDEYESGDNEQQLNDKIEEINQAKETLERRQVEIERYEADKKNLDEFLNNHTKTKIDLEETIKLRLAKKEAANFKAEIEKYNDQLAQDDYNQMERDKSKWQRKMKQILMEKSERTGRLGEIQGSIRGIERELRDPKFRDAAKLFSDTRLSHRCRQHVIDDLEKYHKALNYAINMYHKNKMQIINQIVRELWRETYKGNDIDHIEIKTDEMDPDKGMEARKQCNYKVVMVKNDTEMEMRGRCSAGQKVLASLIIRLALAETFCANCGIIALDEPTTNLDRENIESLSDALANLVIKRANVPNSSFQLIVITHDEDLINSLGRAVDEQEYYYDISRNQRGLSQIKKLRIQGMD